MTCMSCKNKSGRPRLSYNRNSDHTTAQHALQARMTSLPLCWQGKPCIVKRACCLRQYITHLSVLRHKCWHTYGIASLCCPGPASSQARAIKQARPALLDDSYCYLSKRRLTSSEGASRRSPQGWRGHRVIPAGQSCIMATPHQQGPAAKLNSAEA